MRKILQIIFFAFLSFFYVFAADGAGELRMVTAANFPPYEFYSGKEIVGIDADIMREIAARNGLKLIIEDMKFDSIIAAVQSGKGDVAASAITVTPDRRQMVDFTVAYVSARQMIIVPVDSLIKNGKDLKGKRIGVQHGTTGDTYVTENFHDPQRFDDGSMAVAALLRGKLDAVVLDNEPAMVHSAGNPELKMLEEPLTFEEYAFAIAKNREPLLKMLNDSLNEMMQDGTINEIRKKYAEKIEETVAETAAENSGDGGWKSEWHTNFIKNDRWRYLWDGFLVTMQVSVAAVILGVAIGFFVAIIRSTADLNGNWKIADYFCRVYLTVIRGTPVVLQLLIIYFVVFGAVDVSKVLVAIIAFGINSGAYVAEIIRSGIMSIDRGQMEAGRSLGLSYCRTMILIVLPQALKNVLPALGNEFIVLLKETSVCGFIALQDLTKGGDVIRSQTYNAFLPLIVVAMVYLLLVIIFSKLLEKLEKRLKRNE
ncbi:MAG: transporter substrate-binding domain-containing protein [Lentisphaerae bacterium]|nr:transporter substrate-binding domain-containing protein [Lentisphaerota bacterium]